ncbi:MAG TPA: glycosyltransferase [Rectinema sp.]|nr:glycosyltransferase [Rectinema sp.]
MKMQIIFISNTCSEEKYKEVTEIKVGSHLTASQKYFLLLLTGMQYRENVKISHITAIPVDQSNCKKKVWKTETELITDSLKFIYLGFINLKVVKNLSFIINSFITTFRMISEKKDIVLVCDPLAYDASIGAVFAARIKGITCTAILTDIPEYIAAIEKTKMNAIKRIVERIKRWVTNRLINSFDNYVFLTEPMNDVINKKNKPYIIVETAADFRQKDDIKIPVKRGKKIVLYAGGLYEKFGIKTLIEASAYIKTPDMEIHLYGEGSYVPKIIEKEKEVEILKYKGMVSLQEIVEKEKEATLLINPRPSKEEFTVYSFPSKIVEYMSTGTPSLTTKLKGIPSEYYKYMFVIEDETPEGIAEAIDRTLSLSSEFLYSFGVKAKEFVCSKKNNIVQGEKVVDFLSKHTTKGNTI